MSEYDYLKHIKEVSLRNQLFRTYIGQGYYDTIVPRHFSATFLKTRDGMRSTPLPGGNLPGPAREPAEFQTMVGDLTGLPIANASCLMRPRPPPGNDDVFNALNKDQDHITRESFCRPRSIPTRPWMY